MTKEELEKEAYKEAEKIKECQTEPNNEYEKGFNNGEVRGYKDGYRDGAEPREKRIAELEAQIEKMKCCGNCVHFDFNEPNYCHKGVYRERQYVCGEWCFGN